MTFAFFVRLKTSLETDTIQSDGYFDYKQLAKESPLTEHLLCWAYVRAKLKLAGDIAKDVEVSWFWRG